MKRLRDFFRQRGTELKRADIGPLLEKVCRSQAMRAEAAQVVLECHCDDGLPRIWMDPVQIEVVLRNLVSNGVDAALSTPSSDPYVRVHASVEHEHLVIEVLDSGDGIAPVDLPHMFETRRSSKPGGMGIGLLISRSIVEAHEGRLWAEPGPGGKFFVSLPLSEHGHD
ncbi:MAG TPA: ATP-binding protein [Burkholderiaceae bacterium]|nr:ATP-binding protein [Burkholderiaceae bacterium]